MMIQSDFHMFQGGWNHQPDRVVDYIPNGVLSVLFKCVYRILMVDILGNIGHFGAFSISSSGLLEGIIWYSWIKVYSRKIDILGIYWMVLVVTSLHWVYH